MSARPPDWDRLARRAAAVVGEEEPLRLDFGSGRLFVDHAGSTLVVHRCASRATAAPASGTASGPSPDPARDRLAACSAAHRLVTAHPSYLLATGGPDEQDGIRRLARSTVRALADALGAALVIELWTPLGDDHEDGIDPFNRRPGFTLYTPGGRRAQVAADALSDALSEIEIAGMGAEVRCVSVGEIAPPGLPLLLDGPGLRDGSGPLDGEGRAVRETAAEDRTVLLGLAVDAVFLNTREDEFYPGVLEALRSALAPAFARAASTFAEAAGVPVRPRGRRHLEPVAEAVDGGLAACARQYDFLLQVTPVNAAEAWDDFQTSGCARAPELRYRPLTFDPDALRRDLFALPVDAVEDPTVAGLLREKRDELAAEIQMVLDVGTDLFLPGSLRIFGAPGAPLVALAEAVLARLAEDPAPTRGEALIGATAFAAEALAELDYYRARFDGFTSSVDVRKDIPGSLMVAQGQLLVGDRVSVPAARVPALLAHEVGTHVLTYYNGCAQPLRLLRYGLAGYEPLQEGLAVLAEWLVGGLTHGRMRVLAARVLAACALIEGAEFVEAFRLLKERAGLSDRAAFGVTLRVYRGGGLTKDVVYLRGLRDLLGHLGTGGAYWPLFVGKIALAHLPATQALHERGVLGDPPLRPRYASDPAALARLERARNGLTVLDLL